MQSKKGIIILVIAIVVLGGIWLIIKNSANENNEGVNSPSVTTSDTGATQATTPTTDSSATVTPTSGSASASTTKEFTVTGSNYKFEPSTLSVNKGDTVKITFVNSGGMHDFKIDEFNVATERLESGDSTTVTFVADKTGTFQYYCSVGTHRAMGMWGTLTVK